MTTSSWDTGDQEKWLKRTGNKTLTCFCVASEWRTLPLCECRNNTAWPYRSVRRLPPATSCKQKPQSGGNATMMSPVKTCYSSLFVMTWMCYFPATISHLDSSFNDCSKFASLRFTLSLPVITSCLYPCSVYPPRAPRCSDLITISDVNCCICNHLVVNVLLLLRQMIKIPLYQWYTEKRSEQIRDM